MSDEQTPSVEEIKDRLKIEIPVEEEVTKAEVEGNVDVTAELKDLGRQFAETIKTAWNSEERQKLEREIREGITSFVGEVDKVIREAKDSPTAERVREEATQVKTKVESSDIGRKTRGGIVQGLHWLSEELGKLANNFTPSEEEAEAETEETKEA